MVKHGRAWRRIGNGQAGRAHLLDEAPGRVEVNVVVGQQPGAGWGQVQDIPPCEGGHAESEVP